MTTANKARILHVLALLGSLATAVLPAWVDQQQTWPARIALTIVTGLLLAVRTDALKSQRNAILGGLAIAGAVVAVVAGKFTAGTAGFAIAGSVAAVVAQVRVILARELADSASTEPQPKGADSANKIASILALVAALGVSSAARADVPTNQFGGCIVWQDTARVACQLEAGPSVAVTVGRYENNGFSAGLLPGLGYGVTLFPQQWYQVGLAVYGQLSVGAGPNTGALSGLLSFANYVRVGVGETWTQQAAGPAARSTALLFALGSDFGGSSSYLKEEAAKFATGGL